MLKTDEQTVTASQQNKSQAAGMKAQVDVLDYLMQPEVQESLTVLVEHLPRLAEMITHLTKAYEVIQSVAGDRILLEDFRSGMEEFIHPIHTKVKDIASAAVEASDRAQMDANTIGLFGILRMLKDPEVQHMLRFAQAFLAVLSERRNKLKP